MANSISYVYWLLLLTCTYIPFDFGILRKSFLELKRVAMTHEVDLTIPVIMSNLFVIKFQTASKILNEIMVRYFPAQQPTTPSLPRQPNKTKKQQAQTRNAPIHGLEIKHNY